MIGETSSTAFTYMVVTIPTISTCFKNNFTHTHTHTDFIDKSNFKKPGKDWPLADAHLV